MKRLALLLALFASPALAVDNPQTCTGNSCKVTLQPRTTTGAAVQAVTVQAASAGSVLIGINSTSPGATLDVVGTGQFSAGIKPSTSSSTISNFTDWTAVSFSAGNFTTDTGTWTVTSGEQLTYQYLILGKMMFLEVKVNQSSVASSPTQLRVAIPASKTAAVDCGGGTPVYDNNNTSASPGYWRVQPGIGYVIVALNSNAAFAASTTATTVYVNAFFAIN